ncbi:prolipoprotein diacylglyceryl transferase family protein [Paenibacillus cineris]|uniref:prolipoprotein diacylglyceryl transferase family protein n=1 Tax=Paenibacillus cineris TaxID=237530 RepID=UPI00245461C0|nr:prolipoprotein diacylglyceryl transferase family protein [Paenibacillus cineris]
MYWITQIQTIVMNPSSLLKLNEGFVVYGGIIGGIVAGLVYCKKNKISFLQHLDLFVPSIALAQGFGRIGCLLAGCCYGEETEAGSELYFTTPRWHRMTSHWYLHK